MDMGLAYIYPDIEITLRRSSLGRYSLVYITEVDWIFFYDSNVISLFQTPSMNSMESLEALISFLMKF